jgi:hypothetical protein
MTVELVRVEVSCYKVAEISYLNYAYPYVYVSVSRCCYCEFYYLRDLLDPLSYIMYHLTYAMSL